MNMHNKKGFTLIEMLTVLVIIGFLLALLFPALNKARHRARILKAESEIRELTKAWNAYWNTYGNFPNTGTITMDAGNVKVLQGGNPDKRMFMTFPKGADVNGFTDPWGREFYRVKLIKNTGQTATWVYSTTVYLNNRNRQR